MRIEIKADDAGFGSIFVDGQDLSNAVRGIDVRMRVGELSAVTLQMIGEVTLDTEGSVTFEYPHEETLKFKGKQYDSDPPDPGEFPR
jgi:hypothetical protein